MAQDRKRNRKAGPAGSNLKGRIRRSDGIGAANYDFDPLSQRMFFRKLILDALDPDRSPGKIRTLKDMTPEERKRLEEKYGSPKG